MVEPNTSESARSTEHHEGATGRLVVDCSHLPSALFLAATGPKIEVDGRTIEANWGAWPIELSPGRYALRVSTRYMGEMGPATTEVEVTPGGETRVFYRAPATIFSGGSIGPTPQASNGMGGMFVMILIPIVLMLIALSL